MNIEYTNCANIKNLEKQLLCLQNKYIALCNRLEIMRNNSSGDESIIDFQHLLDERTLLAKQIRRLKKRVAMEEKLVHICRTKDEINLGSKIVLKNHSHTLKFTLVESVFSGNQNQISINSPIGKAVIGRRVGEEIKVITPGGEVLYWIEKAE